MPLYKSVLYFTSFPGPWGSGQGWSETYYIDAISEDAAFATEVGLVGAREGILTPDWHIMYRRVGQLGAPRVVEAAEAAGDVPSQGFGTWNLGGTYRSSSPDFGLLVRFQLENGSRAMRFLRGVDELQTNPRTLQYTPSDAFKTAFAAFMTTVTANCKYPNKNGQPLLIKNLIPWRAGTRKPGRPFGTPRKRSRIR